MIHERSPEITLHCYMPSVNNNNVITTVTCNSTKTSIKQQALLSGNYKKVEWLFVPPCQCLQDAAKNIHQQEMQFPVTWSLTSPSSTNMAISETKGQRPVKEGQRYINLNPVRLFLQQPPKQGKGSRGSFKLLHQRLQQGKRTITLQD